MLFNSLEFIIFLIIVFLIYWILDRKKQNIFLLLVSYVFYGWWDYRFLFLMIFSSSIDYFVGLGIYSAQTKIKKKIFLGIALLSNLSILGFFKYYNFFVDSLINLFSSFGAGSLSLQTLHIILPVGISFYTFQSLSYAFDIYKGKMQPTKSYLQYCAFVAFFPQLVAGPIERASRLLIQFENDRSFDFKEAVDGCRQILWGFFKKIVIADNLAVIANKMYLNVFDYSGGEMLIATIFFAFQIYCDFSGYSDIAIGTAKLFGFKLMKNFSYPYFSRNIAEFWRRWHISLSTWFRDYVFIPLGGSRVTSKLKYLKNILIVFTLSGFWHGANWTYITWGFLNGLYYIPNIYKRDKNKNLDHKPTLKEIPYIIITFSFTIFAWIFFRAQNFHEAIYIIKSIFTDFGMITMDILYPKRFVIILILIIVEWIQRDKDHPLMIGNLKSWQRKLIYLTIIFVILFFGAYNYTPFIYFQF